MILAIHDVRVPLQTSVHHVKLAKIIRLLDAKITRYIIYKFNVRVNF